MELELHWSGDWPEYTEPLLTALESLPETEHAPEGSVAFCPDAVQFAPPVSDRVLVAAVPEIGPLFDPSHRAGVAGGLSEWASRGAVFTVPTPAAAATLRALLSLEPGRVRVLPLPLPPGRMPQPSSGIGHDILALGGIDVEVILSANRDSAPIGSRSTPSPGRSEWPGRLRKLAAAAPRLTAFCPATTWSRWRTGERQLPQQAFLSWGPPSWEQGGPACARPLRTEDRWWLHPRRGLVITSPQSVLMLTCTARSRASSAPCSQRFGASGARRSRRPRTKPSGLSHGRTPPGRSTASFRMLP